MWFGYSLQRHKTAPTMLTKFWLGYPNVIAAPWHLKSCSHPDSQHWMGKHSLLLVLQLLSTAKSKAKCWMCKNWKLMSYIQLCHRFHACDILSFLSEKMMLWRWLGGWLVGKILFSVCKTVIWQNKSSPGIYMSLQFLCGRQVSLVQGEMSHFIRESALPQLQRSKWKTTS